MAYMELAELMQARLHWHNKKVYFNGKCTVPEFMTNNKDLLNQIAKELTERYGIVWDNHDVRRVAKAGIKRYLEAEGMLK